MTKTNGRFMVDYKLHSEEFAGYVNSTAHLQAGPFLARNNAELALANLAKHPGFRGGEIRSIRISQRA